MRPIVATLVCLSLSACGGSGMAPMDESRVLSDAETELAGEVSRAGADDSLGFTSQDISFGNLLNDVRIGNGSGSVTYDSRLDAAAQAHADDMLARGYFSHDSPEGEDGFDRITREGYNPRAWGENIAAHQRSAEEVMEGWENSRTHNEMMNLGVFEEFGFAKAGSGRNTRWVLVMGTEAK